MPDPIIPPPGLPLPTGAAFPALPMVKPVMPRFNPFNEAIANRLTELYKTALPSFAGLSQMQRDNEYAFIYNNGGNPGTVSTSHPPGMKDRIAVYPNTAGIIHSHPITSVAYPSGPDIEIAKKNKMPNYVLSQNALWMANPNGQIQQIANVQYKDGQLSLLPASGKNALLHNKP